MGLLGNLFGTKKLKTNDVDFGELESLSISGEKVKWQVNRLFLGFEIEIIIDGNKEGVSASQKQILLNALNNENEIHQEAEKALKEQYDNAEMEFESIEKHFTLRGISLENDGFEMIFQENEGQNYFFNVHFENNKQVGVSIDG